MPFPIEKKLVVGVSSTALFDLETETEIFETKGLKAFKEYQKENKTKILPKGSAFPFIRRFLNINNVYSDEQPVEVVLLSRNSAETGVRIFNSIRHYGLNITRAAFTSDVSPHLYIPGYNISLFLTTNEKDARAAVLANYPAGVVLKTKVEDDETDNELRIAFDFDCVLADDEAEKIFKEKGLEAFYEYEKAHAKKPLHPGILDNFFKKISYFQRLEEIKREQNSRKENSRKEKKNGNNNTPSEKLLRTSIITARNAPAHERAINTLESWGVSVDEMHLLGAIEKGKILSIMKPHLFIDDQKSHLDTSIEDIAMVHLPFGIANEQE